MPIGRQLYRYAIVGVTSNFVLYALYLLFTAIGVGHKTAMTTVYIGGIVGTFIANRIWSFEHSDQPHAAFIRYVVAYAAGYLLNWLLLWVAVDQADLPHQAVQAMAIVLVAGVLFLLHRYWVFRPSVKKGDI